MALEKHIEVESCRIYRELGALDTVKIGRDGWPDRMVLLGCGRVFWSEFKTPTGRLRAVQERRIAKMRAAGEIVFTPRSIDEAARDFAEAKRTLGLDET